MVDAHRIGNAPLSANHLASLRRTAYPPEVIREATLRIEKFRVSHGGCYPNGNELCFELELGKLFANGASCQELYLKLGYDWVNVRKKLHKKNMHGYARTAGIVSGPSGGSNIREPRIGHYKYVMRGENLQLVHDSHYDTVPMAVIANWGKDRRAPGGFWETDTAAREVWRRIAEFMHGKGRLPTENESFMELGIKGFFRAHVYVSSNYDDLLRVLQKRFAN